MAQTYRVVRHDISEARRLLCPLTRAIESSADQTIVVVHRHGVPVAALVSATEVARYLRWRAEEIAREPVDSEPNAPRRDPVDNAADTDAAEVASLVQVPNGWLTPEEYIRAVLREGHSPETVLVWLLDRYGQHGLTPAGARALIEHVRKEQEQGR